MFVYAETHTHNNQHRTSLPRGLKEPLPRATCGPSSNGGDEPRIVLGVPQLRHGHDFARERNLLARGARSRPTAGPVRVQIFRRVAPSVDRNLAVQPRSGPSPRRRCSPSLLFPRTNSTLVLIQLNLKDITAAKRAGAKSVAVFLDQYWRSVESNPMWNTDDATYGLLNDVNAVYGSAGTVASPQRPN